MAHDGDTIQHSLSGIPTMSLIALACAAMAIVILVVFLWKRPHFTAFVKLWLLLGLGVLPIAAAGFGNVQGFHATKQREFCGSCHVMTPHLNDVTDRTSTSLAARHSRNKLFGEESCYTCHADYGMYGTVLTKLGGMRHVWLYYSEFRNVSLPEAKKTIHLLKPYPNSNCMQCHSTENVMWLKIPDHRAALEDVRKNSVGCASAGCHGFAHPFWQESAVTKGETP